MDAAKEARYYFELYPKYDVIYMTADGQFFLDRNAAISHTNSNRLTDMTTFNREDVLKKTKDIKVDMLPEASTQLPKDPEEIIPEASTKVPSETLIKTLPETPAEVKQQEYNDKMPADEIARLDPEKVSYFTKLAILKRFNIKPENNKGPAVEKAFKDFCNKHKPE